MCQQLAMMMLAASLLLGTSNIATCDEPDLELETVRESALRALRRVDDYAGVSLEGRVEGDAIEYSFQLQTVGDRFWLEGTRVGGLTKKDREKNAAHGQALSKIFKRDWKCITCYDGKNLGSYEASKATAKITRTADIGLDSVGTSVFPKYWTCMHQFATNELKFARLLEKGDPTISVEWLSGKRRVRFTQKPSPAVSGFAGKWIEIDTESGFLVSAYGIEGGTLGERKGNIEWSQLADGNWYPKNCVQTINGQLWTQWEISEAIFDMRKIRTKFSLTHESLPFGTKIVHDSNTEYVGGAAAQREFELLNNAATNFQLKN